jgi:benzoyl-CoA reductase/2-hydroxyglutaryl-CoA dehydratase subunit BcrC/BadD/HgdB
VYLQGRVTALAATLAELSGIAPDEGALRTAIAASNASRHALQALNAGRRSSSPRIAGSDILLALRAAGAMRRAAHAALLASVAATQPAAAAGQLADAGPRLMVKGAAHDDTAFYDLVETLGAVIVADDHLTGERIFEHLISEDADPVVAIAEHYQLNVPTIRSYPQSRQDGRFAGLLDEAKVEGVIVLHDEFDDTMGWDWPAQKRILEAKSIPYVLLDRQSYRHPDREAQRAAVANLISRIAK